MAALRPPPFVSALGRGCIVTGIPFRISFPGSQQDGWADLFVTNVDREMHSLYHNNQDETFDDMSIPNGIGRVTPLLSGWGVKYFDFDNDGNIGPPPDLCMPRDECSNAIWI